MGSALVSGLLASGWEAASLAIVEVDARRRAELADEVPGIAVIEEPVDGEGAVLAVKPSVAEAACSELARRRVPRWLSIMAGVQLARLTEWAGPEVAVVRAMPNTPALVGAGMSAYALSPGAGPADAQWAEELLGAVGQVVAVEEPDLDAVTAVSGSGPAYLFLVAEALADAGVAQGLSPEVSRRLALATVAGAGRLLAQPGADPVALRAQVTSPGGTTEAALAELEAAGLREAFAAAVRKAADRSREMGRPAPETASGPA